MSECEVALKLLELVLAKDTAAALDAAAGKEKILALYRECLDAVRGKAE